MAAAGLAPADARHLDDLVLADHLRGRTTKAALDGLRLVLRRAQPHGDVVREVLAADGDDRGVLDGAAVEDGDVRGAAADVDEGDPQLLLVLGQHAQGRGELLEHDVGDVQRALLRATHDVLSARDSARDDVDLGLEAHPAHTEGLLDAVLIVDDEFLGQDVAHSADLPSSRSALETLIQSSGMKQRGPLERKEL